MLIPTCRLVNKAIRGATRILESFNVRDLYTDADSSVEYNACSLPIVVEDIP